VFVIVLGIVLYNPKDIILEAKDKAEAIQQEYVTMLRYTDSRRAQVYRQSLYCTDSRYTVQTVISSV
jgi:hypothetical protein